MEHSKSIYLKFAEDTPDLPLFMHPDWLDIVCTNGQWDVVMMQGPDARPTGFMPYYMRSWYGLKAITMPVLTPFMGLWLDIPEGLTHRERYKREEKILTGLIRGLPPHQLFEQRFHSGIRNILPFLWAGYRQQTRYTFRFDHVDPQQMEQGLSKKFRQNLSTAESHCRVVVSDDIDVVYRLSNAILENKGEGKLFGPDLLQKIDMMLAAKGRREILTAVDAGGHVLCAVYIIWDQTTSYYLLSGRSENASHHAFNALLLWHAIKGAGRRGQGFDFEGSMIPGVYRFFRNFNAPMQAYSEVFRYRSYARWKHLLR